MPPNQPSVMSVHGLVLFYCTKCALVFADYVDLNSTHLGRHVTFKAICLLKKSHISSIEHFHPTYAFMFFLWILIKVLNVKIMEEKVLLSPPFINSKVKSVISTYYFRR